MPEETVKIPEIPRSSLYRPMANGIIEIKVKDGKVAGAVIRED